MNDKHATPRDLAQHDNAAARSGSAPSGNGAGGTAGGDHGNGAVGGHTKIADVVVESIAGIAARQASGVYTMGGGAARAMGAVRERLGGESHTRGVHAEVGEKQAAIDLDFVVEYGSSITDTARRVRSSVAGTVGSMTGLEVVEVNIDVVDVHVPGSDDSSADEDTDDDRHRDDAHGNDRHGDETAASHSRVQ